MAKLIILYGPPDDPDAFEDYYSAHHIPYASMDDLRAGLASADGQATIADLANFATGGATLLIADD